MKEIAETLLYKKEGNKRLCNNLFHIENELMSMGGFK